MIETGGWILLLTVLTIFDNCHELRSKCWAYFSEEEQMRRLRKHLEEYRKTMPPSLSELRKLHPEMEIVDAGRVDRVYLRSPARKNHNQWLSRMFPPPPPPTPTLHDLCKYYYYL